jgi:hypothetical protein
VLRSMPNIPFLGALFGSSSSNMGPDTTNYPVKKTEGEWQVQLSPGTRLPHLLYPYLQYIAHHLPSCGTSR